MEAISVICEFERLKNYFAVGRNRSGEMIEFGNTLSKWKYEIVNSFVPANGRRISNGLIENRNKAIKLLKHSSNGYLNWNRFRTRIMFSLNNDTTYHMYPINNKGDYTK